jgi:ribonucleoside-diphosphate reductase alpha chain
VFRKLGKQGSTLAGVMDAFSMAISVGRQYGIPLESYVAKFTNMRFEPAGLALDHLPTTSAPELGILSAAE